MKIKLELEYSPGTYSGWQSQPGLLTIQGELENALAIFLKSQYKKAAREEPGETNSFVTITGSGRTDAGVFAKGQAASFSWPSDVPIDTSRLKCALNALTSRELLVRNVEVMRDDYDARHSPHVKCYKYNLVLGTRGGGYYGKIAWCVGEQVVDIPAMISAARYLRGCRDYSSFRAKDCTAKSTVRTLLLSELSRTGPNSLVYVVCGSGFLKQMIRIIVGTLVDVGKEKITFEEFKNIVEARDRRRAGQTAPACGLVLEWVRYADNYVPIG